MCTPHQTAQPGSIEEWEHTHNALPLPERIKAYLEEKIPKEHHAKFLQLVDQTQIWVDDAKSQQMEWWHLLDVKENEVFLAYKLQDFYSARFSSHVCFEGEKLYLKMKRCPVAVVKRGGPWDD